MKAERRKKDAKVGRQQPLWNLNKINGLSNHLLPSGGRASQQAQTFAGLSQATAHHKAHPPDEEVTIGVLYK